MKMHDSSCDEDIPPAPKSQPWQKNKKRYSLLLCYNGRNYHGMQYMPNVTTVEGQLISALTRAQLIPPNNLAKLFFQRSSRTDKGVSALKNIVALNISSNILQSIDQVNSLLPPDIRLICAERVGRSFNCHRECSSRNYIYYVPSFALVGDSFHWDGPPISGTRIESGEMERVGGLLRQFVGTHNFHNFTTGTDMPAKTNNRHIFSIELCPTLSLSYGDRQIEFVPVRLVGQSFLLHQIRKMMGVVIAVSRGIVGEGYIPELFQQRKLFTPLAPSYGLLLESVNYGAYNDKRRRGSLSQLEWEGYEGVIRMFRDENILPDLAVSECEHSIMADWLRSLTPDKFRET